MKYRTLGRTDLAVSEIACGTWAFASNAYGKVSEEDAIATVRTALDVGITFFDTAPLYGDSEQFVGQHLLYSQPCFVRPELFFWMREKRSSNAEVDYVISMGTKIIPIEVKAGRTGTLKSLQVFLNAKGQKMGVRLNSAPPTWYTANYALPEMSDQSFELVSLPFYLVGQVRRLLEQPV